MRESILFSGSVRKLLSVFVTNPNDRFYLRQLSVLINGSLRPIQLALAKLEKAGILNADREANIKFYSLNKKSPIYSEIKNIILKTEAVGETLRDGLKDIKRIECAFIYGSVANDKERAGSDIDICIIGEADLGSISKTTARLEGKLKREISVVTFSPKEWAEGFKEKKPFIMDILKNKKIILMGNIDEF